MEQKIPSRAETAKKVATFYLDMSEHKLIHLNTKNWTSKFAYVPKNQDYITSCDTQIRANADAQTIEIIE
jgi:hypothetical protein